jgi:hypothetical protein
LVSVAVVSMAAVAVTAGIADALALGHTSSYGSPDFECHAEDLRAFAWPHKCGEEAGLGVDWQHIASGPVLSPRAGRQAPR